MRAGIYKYLKEAEYEAEVKAVVVVGKGGKFCAGADIKEFDGGKSGVCTSVCFILCQHFLFY